MDPTTIVFTMWIGSFSLPGNTPVYMGRACASDRNCKGGYMIKPTFDADYEVIIEPTKTTMNAS